MAVAIDARTDGGSGSTITTLSWTHIVGASLSNSILVVCVMTSKAVTGINWDQAGTPTALTKKGSIQNTGLTDFAEVWYLLNPSAGTKTIQITVGAAGDLLAGSASYSGVDQTTPFNAASPQTQTGAAPTTPSLATTSDVNGMVVDCFSYDSNAGDTLVVGTGQTTIVNNLVINVGPQGAASDKAGAASVTMAWTGTLTAAPGTWAYMTVGLRPVGAVAANKGGFFSLM